MNGDGGVGFIPTCVGNTSTERKKNSFMWVHPHVCGEYSMRAMPRTSVLGSSPRVWGILPNQMAESPQRRFIPTCVGNTSPSKSIAARTWVHPHVCGEYSEIDAALKEREGSSPRVWGIPLAMASS